MESLEDHYNYPVLIKEKTKDLPSIEGGTLEDVVVNIVEPEYNILNLKVNNVWYAIHGAIGGEFLSFNPLDKPVTKEVFSPGNYTTGFPPFDIFLNRQIISVRQLGEAWNGHGFEISFKDLPDKTLLVQTIYTGSGPEDYHDCIKVGIGNYFFSTELQSLETNPALS